MSPRPIADSVRISAPDPTLSRLLRRNEDEEETSVHRVNLQLQLKKITKPIVPFAVSFTGSDQSVRTGDRFDYFFLRCTVVGKSSNREEHGETPSKNEAAGGTRRLLRPTGGPVHHPSSPHFQSIK